MDPQTPDLAAWVPAACTLPTAERPVRLAAFDELLTSRVTRVERPAATRLRLDLTPTAEVAAQVAQLAHHESTCCAFFTFTLTIGADRLRLDVDVPAAHASVLDALVHEVGAPESAHR